MKFLTSLLLVLSFMAFTSCAHKGHAKKECCKKKAQKSCCKDKKKECKDGKSCDLKKKECKDGKSCDLKKKDCAKCKAGTCTDKSCELKHDHKSMDKDNQKDKAKKKK